ncbi:DNA polymerase III subunit chi [Commensalibacter oyaizuii]|uniref:DNA polymerase III subunit chi n=1 Tax=Commensalibacter oyaizuii TaxID=3043873 RepID=A0ABT6Q0H6_9PROT|nr:DNA polymerase III subunit chi [Commensalibacter sp. TBRC 16381]MDI2090616.1 DNA polymerase III subunit chi [Commensalibacter sp. TBRC 16381]
MASVGFYHLTKTDLQQALPLLLIRTMQANERGLVLCKDDQQVQGLTEALWRVSQPIWLPHGCHTSDNQDDFPQWQPIWLTVFEENLNQAAFLFLVGGQSEVNLTAFKRVFDLFDGNDPDAVQQARQRWRLLKQNGHDLTYWKQTDKGWGKGV